MFIYNVTVLVNHSIHDDWKTWMVNEHIPEIMATGCFEKYLFLRIIEVDETEGITYAVQYYSPSKAIYNRYIQKFAPALRKKTTEKWSDNLIAFRTLMQLEA